MLRQFFRYFHQKSLSRFSWELIQNFLFLTNKKNLSELFRKQFRYFIIFCFLLLWLLFCNSLLKGIPLAFFSDAFRSFFDSPISECDHFLRKFLRNSFNSSLWGFRSNSLWNSLAMSMEFSTTIPSGVFSTIYFWKCLRQFFQKKKQFFGKLLRTFLVITTEV